MQPWNATNAAPELMLTIQDFLFATSVTQGPTQIQLLQSLATIVLLVPIIRELEPQFAMSVSQVIFTLQLEQLNATSAKRVHTPC